MAQVVHLFCRCCPETQWRLAHRAARLPVWRPPAVWSCEVLVPGGHRGIRPAHHVYHGLLGDARQEQDHGGCVPGFAVSVSVCSRWYHY